VIDGATEQLFPRSIRLLHSKDFQKVFNQVDCKSADRYLVLLAHRNNLGYSRLGMAIAKKKIRKAVQRNRIKRLVRETFRLHKNHCLGLDIVVMSNSAAANTVNAILMKNLHKHWETLANRCKK